MRAIRGRHGLGPLGPLEAQIIADLEVEGVHVTSIDRLLPYTAAAIRESFASAAVILQERGNATGSAALWNRGCCSTDLRADVLLTRLPLLYMLGLDPRLLLLVRHYLRLPVAYHGAVVRHSLVDGEGAGTRLWHMDAEDFHVFRMVIYMNDVDLGGGPFEYIPRSLGLTYRAFANPALTKEHMLPNDHMRAVVPERQWKRVYGPAGTVVICDTAQTFHHESLQTKSARSVVMIGYSSRRPKSLQLAMAHFPVESVRTMLAEVVPSMYHEHVFNWRRPETELA